MKNLANVIMVIVVCFSHYACGGNQGNSHAKDASDNVEESVNVSDRKTFTKDDLEGGWVCMDSSQAIERTIHFMDTFYAECVKYNNLNHQACKIGKYYLSDSIENKFDHSRLGKSRKGRYIIGNETRAGGATLRRVLILSLSKDSLVCRRIPDNGAKDTCDVTMHFKRKIHFSKN